MEEKDQSVNQGESIVEEDLNLIRLGNQGESIVKEDQNPIRLGNHGNHGNHGNQGNQGNHGNQGNQRHHGKALLVLAHKRSIIAKVRRKMVVNATIDGKNVLLMYIVRLFMMQKAEQINISNIL